MANSSEVVQSQAIIVGAGPAGLAVGACLRQANLSGLILEQADQVGASWRRHYDRLHLHTTKAQSQLPFYPFPPDYPRYPSREQLIGYLEAYTRRFHLEPRLEQQVVAARFANGFWEVQTQDTRYQTPSLVIATGYISAAFTSRQPGCCARSPSRRDASAPPSPENRPRSDSPT